MLILNSNIVHEYVGDLTRSRALKTKNLEIFRKWMLKVSSRFLLSKNLVISKKMGINSVEK